MRLVRQFGGRLYRKYVATFVLLIGAVLVAGGASDLYFSYYETRDATVALNREKALAAAIRIEQFIREIEQHVGWTNLLPRGGDPSAQRHIEFIKLLRQSPAITDVVWLDSRGREQLRVSRLAMDRLHAGADFSSTPAFKQTNLKATYRGPVYFREGTEPYMTLAVKAGEGVTLVEVNLKFVWDVITGIRFGRTGVAYVVDGQGQLVSHPDISQVLKKTDLSRLPQVRQARAAPAAGSSSVSEEAEARDLAGTAVLAASAHIDPLDWFVFVEQSREEAFTPLVHSMLRTGLLMLLGLVLALAASAVLVRRMVEPIRALQEGAARMGAGELDQRIEVRTNDEIEVLAREFNQMAAQLRESYAGLEQKVAERTEELVAANRAKSRFLAAASHDLRQPMHALGLFVTQLNSRIQDPENRRLTGRIEAAVTALQGLLDALLDVSRLDAGVVTPNLASVPVRGIFERIENAFAPDAMEKELRFRVVRSDLAVTSDPVLLERILINLVANALRYTEHGGVLIGCRRRGGQVRIEVCDTGIGIAPEHQAAIFQEFYQVGNPERDRQKGLGLGLAIAARLARLLGARIELRSVPGRGSVFAVEMPRAETVADYRIRRERAAVDDRLHGACVLVVDDDALVREALAGLMEQWGCEVIAVPDGAGALAAVEALAAKGRRPDAALCDYRLPAGEIGGEVIRRLRERLGPDLPAALITGDTAPERLREARETGVPLLHKPVQPARLRALVEHLVAPRAEQRVAV